MLCTLAEIRYTFEPWHIALCMNFAPSKEGSMIDRDTQYTVHSTQYTVHETNTVTKEDIINPSCKRKIMYAYIITGCSHVYNQLY